MKLLEDELDRSMLEASSLRDQLSLSNEESEKVPKLQSLMQQFSTESKEMLESITRLERENEQLEAQALSGDGGGGGGGSATDDIDPNALADLQQQLLDAQSQYAELEERYLDLKMQSI